MMNKIVCRLFVIYLNWTLLCVSDRKKILMMNIIVHVHHYCIQTIAKSQFDYFTMLANRQTTYQQDKPFTLPAL
jgi:hypothetical protein